MTPKLEALFSRLEAAVDKHPRLVRITAEDPVRGEPVMKTSRHGCVVEIALRIKGRRLKPFNAQGYGDTPEEAVRHLVDNLDHVAEAFG